MRPSRAVANHDMTPEVYVDVMQTWLRKYPAASLSTILGPLVEDARGVSTTSLVRAMPLLHMFVERGAAMGVLLTYRLELAWARVLQDQPALVVSNAGHDAAMLTVHIASVFKVLRAVKREDELPGSARRFPKTGHLRRRLTSADWAVLRPTMSILNESSPGNSERMRSTSPASTARSEDGWPSFARLLSEGDLDRSRTPTRALAGDAPDSDWPSFSSLLAGVRPSVSAMVAGEASTAFVKPVVPASVDNDVGLSICICAPSIVLTAGAKPVAPSCADDDAKSDAVPVATPNQRNRKKVALEIRSSKKAAKPPRPVEPRQPEKPTRPQEHGAKPAPPINLSVEDTCFKRVRIARTKNEKVPRCQITAIVDVNGCEKRIHVLTITLNGWGSSFSSAADKLEQFCRSQGATKNKAAAFRDSLYS